MEILVARDLNVSEFSSYSLDSDFVNWTEGQAPTPPPPPPPSVVQCKGHWIGPRGKWSGTYGPLPRLLQGTTNGSDTWGEEPVWRFKIKRTTPITTFMNMLSRRGGVPTDRLRLWSINRPRLNRAVRVGDVLSPEEMTKDVGSLCTASTANDVFLETSVRVFLEELPGRAVANEWDLGGDTMEARGWGMVSDVRPYSYTAISLTAAGPAAIALGEQLAANSTATMMVAAGGAGEGAGARAGAGAGALDEEGALDGEGALAGALYRLEDSDDEAHIAGLTFVAARPPEADHIMLFFKWYEPPPPPTSLTALSELQKADDAAAGSLTLVGSALCHKDMPAHKLEALLRKLAGRTRLTPTDKIRGSHLGTYVGSHRTVELHHHTTQYIHNTPTPL